MIPEYIKSMPIEEKVAHLIITRGCNHIPRITEMVKEGKIGGIGAAALVKKDFDGVIDQLNEWKSLSPIPLFLYVDAEWGLAQVMQCGTRLPHAMALAAAENSEEMAALHARVAAREARALGFHIISNGVLDINSNPKNPIICTRAFSDDTDEVIRLNRAYMKAMQEEGIIPTGKHYPGHGDTAEDSHMAMPVVNRSKEELYEVELRPYREIGNDMWGVMTAHIYYPALSGEGEEGVPATLSRTVLYDILRGEFGYENLIISDSLTMKGIKDKYGLSSATGAIKAGHDLILQDYADDPINTYNAVLATAKSGEIPMEYIDESLSRIMFFKEKLGCMENAPVDREEARKIVSCPEHIEAARKMAKASVTAIENKNLPLDKERVGKVLIISTVGPEEESVIADLGISSGLASVAIGDAIKRYCDADIKRIPEAPDAKTVNELIELSSEYDTVISASFIRTSSYKATGVQMASEQIRLLTALSEKCGITYIPLFFGSPYVLSELPEFGSALLCYSDDIYSIEAMSDALFGEFSPTGKLPVKVSEKYIRGYRA